MGLEISWGNGIYNIKVDPPFTIGGGGGVSVYDQPTVIKGTTIDFTSHEADTSD